MFIAKKELEKIILKQETQRQVSLYLMKLIALLLGNANISPQKLRDLLEWKEVESKKYLDELVSILNEEGRQDTFKSMTGLDLGDYNNEQRKNEN